MKMDEHYVLKMSEVFQESVRLQINQQNSGAVWTFTHTMFILLMQNMSCIFASNHGSQNTEERRNPHGVGRRLSKLARL